MRSASVIMPTTRPPASTTGMWWCPKFANIGTSSETTVDASTVHTSAVMTDATSGSFSGCSGRRPPTAASPGLNVLAGSAPARSTRVTMPTTRRIGSTTGSALM